VNKFGSSLVGALLVVLPGACGMTQYPGTPRPSVSVVGGSEVATAAPQLEAALRERYGPTIDGVSSSTAAGPAWPARIPRDIAATHPVAVVVHLGSGDAAKGLSAQMPAAIDAVMQKVPSYTVVIWDTVRPSGPHHDALDAVNRAIAEAVPRWPNLRIGAAPDRRGREAFAASVAANVKHAIG